MEHPGGSFAMRAEDLLRLLASAAAAVRLYPPSSPLRQQPIERFADAANSVTAARGPIQYRVDRERFIVEETPIGESVPQVAALAENLHALQVGQLIVAPGVAMAEVARFLEILGSDAKQTRARGGARKALLDNEVKNIAVVEVTLRTSTEAGILGLDLTTAPLDDIARELTSAVATWARDASAGEPAEDAVAIAVDRLEPAARDLALQRCAEALLYLDEDIRTRILSAALSTDAGGNRMQGMLDVIAHMPPNALARLLRLTAEHAGREDDAVLGIVEFPPEVAAELAALLRPAAQSEHDRGIPPEADVDGIVQEVATPGDEDFEHIAALVAATTRESAAVRGLTTTLAVAREHQTPEAVRAIAEAVPAAVAAGAYDEVASAADLLASLSSEPELGASVQAARQVLIAPELLRECVRRLVQTPEAPGPRTLLEAVGTAGAEAFLEGYVEASQVQRADLVPAAGLMATSIAPVAGRILRSGDPDAAVAVVDLLGRVHVRRLLPTIAIALDHLDSHVREAAVVAVAEDRWPESSEMLQKALTHWDPGVRRLAAREIGRAGLVEAVPALLRIVGTRTPFERDYELKKEALKSLEALHSPQAEPTLSRLARRKLVFGKKSRELRYLARAALESLGAPEGTNDQGAPS